MCEPGSGSDDGSECFAECCCKLNSGNGEEEEEGEDSEASTYVLPLFFYRPFIIFLDGLIFLDQLTVGLNPPCLFFPRLSP